MLLLAMNSTIRAMLPLAMLLSATAAGGCASNSIEIGVTTRAETYLEIDDRFELLTADPPRCAMLPAIMTGTNPGRGVAADMAIDQALKRNYQTPRFSFNASPEPEPINVVQHYQVADRCLDNGLLEDLRKLLASHASSNYPDPDVAARIARCLGVRYLIFPQVTGVSTDNAGRFTFAGLTFIRTGWISMEGTLQIWDAESRGMAWQSAGQCSLTAENVVGISPPVQSAMDALFGTLIGDFAIGRSASIVSGTLDEPSAATPTRLKVTDSAPANEPTPEIPTAPTSNPAADEAGGKAIESSGTPVPESAPAPNRDGGTP